MVKSLVLLPEFKSILFLILSFTKFTESLIFEDGIFLSVCQVTIGNSVVTRAFKAFS